VAYKKGDRVLVNIEPQYGEWTEAVVVRETVAVEVCFEKAAIDALETFDTDRIIPLPKEASK
jgi:hypothetical protein